MVFRIEFWRSFTYSEELDRVRELLNKSVDIDTLIKKEDL